MSKAGQIINAPSSRRNLALVGEQPLDHVDRVDLNGNLAFLRRRWWVVLACVAAALAIGAIFTFTQEREYTAHSVVSLVQPPEDVDQTGVATTSGPTPSSSFVDTQIEIIESREMALRVAEGLGLLRGLDAQEVRELLNTIQSGVSAERSGESFALMISYEGATGEEASARVNELARQFVQWELSAAQARSSGAIDTIESRLEELRLQAASDTAALQQYRINNNLLSTSGASLTEQEISSYNREVTQARAEVAEAQARLNTAMAQLRSGSIGDDVGEALGSEVIRSLRAQESSVAAEVASLSSRYGPNHPELMSSREELAEIRSRIDAEIQRIISNLRAQLAVAQQRLASLNGSLSNARSQLQQNNSAMVGLDQLERAAEASQGLYETFLNSYKQLVASDGTQLANAQVLTFAETPVFPSSPNIPLNMALSLILGLGLGILAAFIVESMSRSIWNVDQIHTGLGERYLGSIPLLASVSKEKKPISAIGLNPRSAYAESYRSLRTSIEQASFGPTQVIAVTSAVPKEGKTVTSTALAQTLALSGSRTVLVDCDAAKRGLSRLLERESGLPGLLEVLSGEARLEDAIVNTEAGLSLLPITENSSPSERLIGGEAMDNLIAKLRQDFDHVVLDLPPILAASVSRALAEKADTTIMLVRWRKTHMEAVQSALRQMPRDRINVAGVVMTQVDFRRSAFLGRSDPSSYYYQYEEYYS